MTDCGSRLYVDVETLYCNRNTRHYNKPHRADGTWVSSTDNGLANTTVTWESTATDWDDEEEQT